jgi:hypothetical protein
LIHTVNSVVATPFAGGLVPPRRALADIGVQ